MSDYPNMWMTRTPERVSLGYHQTKIPAFAQGSRQHAIEIKEPEEIQWLAEQMEILRQRMWESSTNHAPWAWFKELSPYGNFYLWCQDGYRATLTGPMHEKIELAYQGVQFVAEKLESLREVAK